MTLSDTPEAPVKLEAPGPGRRAPAEMTLQQRWAAVILLMLVGVLNYVDRFLPAVLAEPIKRDLALSDAALGFINGLGFLVIYAVVGIPIARVADSGRYGLVISASLGLWSLMTMLGGFVQSAWQLALTRMGVAVGEAGNVPAAHAFVSRHFPPDRRAAPLAVLTMSIPFANMVGLMGGGLMGAALGWRTTFLVMGALSLLLAPLVLVVLGKGSRAPVAPPASAPRAPILTAYKSLLGKRSFATILAASSCISVGAYSLVVFAPAFLMRSHGLSVAEVGVQYGLVTGVVGTLGLVSVGVLSDRLSSRDPRWLLWVLAAMLAIFAPCTWGALIVDDAGLALGLLALGNVISMAYLAPVIAALQRLTPVEMRASASAILLFLGGVLGGVGPLITGLVSDALAPQYGPEALGKALLLAPAFYVLSAALYVLATRWFRQEVAAEPQA